MFNWGEFEAASGRRLPWKLELDDLLPADWFCLARLTAARFPFGAVEGVPRGGLKLARALEAYASPRTTAALLIVDDVFTTGGSMERQRAGRAAQGVVVYARGLTPAWIEPIFQLWSVPCPPPSSAA